MFVLLPVAKNAAPWWVGETHITLSAVPRHLPQRDDGRAWSVSSAYRWSTEGHCGVRLRRFRSAPGQWSTTVEELARWQAALSSLSGEDVA